MNRVAKLAAMLKTCAEAAKQDHNVDKSTSDDWQISRRTLCAAPLLMAAVPKSGGPSLSDDVAKYVGFGHHRAGDLGERRTADWLSRRLSALGYQTQVDPVPIQTLLNPGGRLTISGKTTELFPQWLPPVGALGTAIKAPLLPLEAETRTPAIRILSSPAKNSANWVPAFDALVRDAVDKNAVALVIAVDHAADGLYVCNQHAHSPFSIPVGLCARADLSALGQAARLRAVGSQTEALFQLEGQMKKTKALNVIGRKPGKGRTLVISTPLTGWFHCGGERGPGIALWLRTAAQLARQPNPVLMLGTGSHEIGHLGMEYALAHRTAPSPADVALWLHFGASLGATRLDARYNFKSVQALVGLPETEALAKATLSALIPFYLTGNGKTLGEAGQIIGAGYNRFIGLSGFFPTFHTAEDRGEAIDFGTLEAIAKAANALIQVAPR
jgi:hypothetical protein